jgi:hypothetical protein
MDGGRSLPHRSLIAVALLAVIVGGLAGAGAADAGAGACTLPVLDSGAAAGSTDAVCSRMVATLAERVGLVTAALTAILLLTVIGLSRVAEERSEA